ncbi:MAG: aminoacyl-tRNA hydrolase [Myxococcales bacterium]|jgi:PTH1 family peptidyl-tRNA hydrolase|nr:aminoacyl-tRNA hydrolase [Myxococcales bacterium]
MKLIVGLGNPGREYEATRHNLGFRVVDALAARAHIDLMSTKFSAESGQGALAGHKVLLLKPQTFMNLSGQSVGPAAHFYKVAPEDIVVIHDELDLALGRLQLRSGGGTGGHNGLKSIVQCLGSGDFVRVRVGIGKPQGPEARERVVGHVLSKFSVGEASQIDEAIDSAAQAIEALLEGGLAKAMNAFNRR